LVRATTRKELGAETEREGAAGGGEEAAAGEPVGRRRAVGPRS
jgi:hypothetical protein